MFASRQRENFAANLKWLCSKQPSIAEVCRATGINRQQFNHYLAGNSVPTALIMRRICHYFEVPEKLMLQSPEFLRQTINDADTPFILHEFLSDLQLGPAQLPVGYYYRYQFSSLTGPSRILRVLLHLRSNGKHMRFRGVRSLMPANLFHHRFRRHRLYGKILGLKDMTYIFEANSENPSGIALSIYGKPINENNNLRAGLIMRTCATSRGAARVALEYLGETVNIRKAVLGCGYLPAKAPEIAHAILDLIKPGPDEKSTTLNGHPKMGI